MKKILLWAVLLWTGSLLGFAQNKNITISGNVIESETKEAVLQATVQLLLLPDSTYIAGAATVAQGKFTLPKVQAGNYILKVSYIGFQSKLIPFQLTGRNLNVSAGTIELESDAILLQEAVIVAEAPPVTVVEDTVIYAASAYRTAEGAMLEELVKKLPGAEVSEEGKITINGKEVKKIMVDGKEFFSDDPQVSMKNLPVNMVENVKAYDRKSDMARITGIDDGEEETVLDLTVKKGMKQGWIGNLITGYGSEERYEAGVMVSRFKDDASFSVVGSANNTNSQGFSEFGDAGQGMNAGRDGRGVTSIRSLGMNFAKDTKKLQVGGNVQYGYSDNDAYRKSSTERFFGNESSYGNSINSSNRKRHDVRVDFRLEWRLDTMTTIIFRPGASYSQTNSSSTSWSQSFDNNRKIVNDKDGNSFNERDNFSINGRLEMYRKLNSKGRNISLTGRFGYSDSETNGNSFSETNFYKNEEPDSLLIIDRRTDRNSDSRNWSASASYTEPIFKNYFLQFRYEFAHRKRLSQSLIYDNLSEFPDVYVDSLSSRVENFYNTHTFDASVRAIHAKMMYSAGLSLTPQSSLSETTIGPNASNHLPKQNVLNFSPQIMFRYMFNRQHVLMFRYWGRSQEPEIEDLQEVIDQTDPLNIRYGNPNLKPSFTHSVMMFYNKYIPEHMRSYAMNMFYSRTSNSVSNKSSIDPNTGGIVSRRVNVNGNWNARGFLSFNTPLKNKKFTVSSNTNAGLSDVVSYTSIDRKSQASQESELSTTHNFLMGERLTGNYRTDNFDISLNASINYNLARNSKKKDSNRETFDYYFGGSTNITLPWQLYFSTDINLRLKDGYSGNLNNSETIWNAQVSKNILKNNAGTIRFKIYDILQQQSNLTRSISEAMLSDTESNTLGSYFMVHFVYRFNTLGGKAPQRNNHFEEGPRRRHEGGRSPGHGPRGSGGSGGPGGSGGYRRVTF